MSTVALYMYTATVCFTDFFGVMQPCPSSMQGSGIGSYIVNITSNDVRFSPLCTFCDRRLICWPTSSFSFF